MVNMTVKKQPEAIPDFLNPDWNRGFIAGSQQQRKSDIYKFVESLETLEEIKGIGTKTAWKIREHYLNIMQKK